MSQDPLVRIVREAWGWGDPRDDRLVEYNAYARRHVERGVEIARSALRYSAQLVCKRCRGAEESWPSRDPDNGQWVHVLHRHHLGLPDRISCCQAGEIHEALSESKGT